MLSVAQKIKQIMDDPLRGKVLRATVPEFAALVELMVEENLRLQNAEAVRAAYEAQRMAVEQSIRHDFERARGRAWELEQLEKLKSPPELLAQLHRKFTP